MKIALIIQSMEISGGTQRQIVMLARELHLLGHFPRIYTFSLNRDVCFPDDLRNLSITALSQPGSKFLKKLMRLPFFGIFIYEWVQRREAKQLANLIDSDIEVLNPHDQPSMRVAYYARRRNPQVPSVLMLSDLHIRSWSLFQDPAFQEGHPSFIRRLYHRMWDRYENITFFNDQVRIAVLNIGTKKRLEKLLGRKAEVVRSGVESNEFPFVQRTLINKRPVQLLAHGIFYIHRRFEDIIRAVKILKEAGHEVELTIIGDYRHKDTAREYHDMLCREIEKLELKKEVHFRGSVSEEELRRAYKEADIFIFASHMQTWGIAVFEAMASGLPVILSSTAGASEVLSDRETALIVSPLDPSAIAHAATQLITDQNLYRSLSEHGAKFVRERITWRRYTADLLNLFEQAIVSKRI